MDNPEWDKSLPSIPRMNSTSSSSSNNDETREPVIPSTSRIPIQDISMPLPSSPLTNRTLSNKTSLPSLPSNGEKKSKRQQSINNVKKALDPPTISLSASSSTQSNLGSPATQSHQALESMTEGGGLKTSRRSKSGDEAMDEWANADLEEGESATIGEQNGAKDSKNIKSPGKSLFGKRSRTNLRIFGGSSNKGDSSSTSREPIPIPRRGSDTSSIFDPRASVSSQSTNHSQHSTSHFPSSSQSSQNNPNVAGRIGGWFSSMLHTTNSTTSTFNNPLYSSKSSSSPSKSFTTSSPFSSPSSKSTTPKKQPPTSNNGGRLGPLDRMLDKAVQYFLDSDSTADQCEEEIWVLGVCHPGFQLADQSIEGSSDDTRSTSSSSVTDKEEKRRKKKGGIGMNFGKNKKGKERLVDDTLVEGERSASPSLSINSPSPSVLSSPTLSPQTSIQLVPSNLTTTNGWPSQFYHDFYSRIALTYRSGFPPIPCSPIPSTSGGSGGGGVNSVFNTLSMSMGRVSGSRTVEGLCSDTGWGCMLRTGQSLLANTLVTIHLGRDWRRALPSTPSTTISQPPTPFSLSPQSTSTPLPLLSSSSQSQYTRILSLFIDDPSPLAPFSVHRFALKGKQLGKEVGEWFGPSTAAGAIKSLVNDYEPAGLKVYSALDGTVYKSEVKLASMGGGKKWSQPVLVLIGLRLGIDGVNPIYHGGIKAIFQFPQSMGIAGGRPSSSYYFVGSQANSLFYIDPHHPRPSIPIKVPPFDLSASAQSSPLFSPSDVNEKEKERLEEFFLEAYPDSALRSYHTEKPRKMPIASLDPSMLLGFLIQDEEDWNDFASRVRELNQDHRPIFDIAENLPSWMKERSTTTTITPGGGGKTSSRSTSKDGSTTLEAEEDEESLDPGAEFFSEPDDWELDSSESISTPPLEGTFEEEEEEGEGEEEEEWEEAPTELVQSTEEDDFDATTPSRSRRVVEGSEDSDQTRKQSWHSAPEEELLILVDSNSPATPTALTHTLSLPYSTPLPSSSPLVEKTLSETIPQIGGAGVLVKGTSEGTVEFDKRDEGWEGVGLTRNNSSSREIGKEMLESIV